MMQPALIDELLTFLKRSPTPFHSVQQCIEMLENSGYDYLDESRPWQLKPGGRYYTTRNDSSIIAFHTGKGDITEQGIRMLGAHTDSPCLKVKPNAVRTANSYIQLAVEVYGGALLNPWFDRDLSLAGRVSFRRTDGSLHSTLIDFTDPVAIIPSVAIHLDRTQNENKKINAQTDLPPIIAQLGENEEKPDFNQLLAQQIVDENLDRVLDWELYFYDTQDPAVVGLRKEFIASARLDNLLSCFIGLKGLIASDLEHPSLVVFNDHEEVGSQSASGAGGPFLLQTLERWLGGNDEARSRVMRQSLMVSTDNAHGVHPNFASFHEPGHQPLLNHGPVLKVNANQRYASNSKSQALFRHFCDVSQVPLQTFVARTDLGCGSTIGPITAAGLGINTVDIGLPTFAMHSIRETAGTKDVEWLFSVLQHYFNSDKVSF